MTVSAGELAPGKDIGVGGGGKLVAGSLMVVVVVRDL